MRQAPVVRLSLVLALLCACTGRTTVEPRDHAEAGFVDVPGARMFYDYQPADDGDARKPLMVLTNGGPGWPTSSGLLSYGVGRATLDEAGDDTPHENRARWTRFAGLLFVDERSVGFSHLTPPPSGPAAPCTMEDDAIDYVRVILGFLDAHPEQRTRPVVLVGESYGGARVLGILDQLRHPRADVRDLVRAHFGGDPTPEQVATQFGAIVLIEPWILGSAQYRAQAAIEMRAPLKAPGRDPDDVRKPEGWSESLEQRAERALADPASRRVLLGVDFDPEGRPFGVDSTCIATDMARADHLALTFVDTLKTTRVFITHARWDAVIRTEAIVDLFRESALLLDERDGSFTVSIEGKPIVVRHPTYDAGHMVAAGAPDAFASDVERWLTQ